ncbi:MAG: type II secretion system F family protein [Pyrinomonadaceae bacterium]
MPTYVFKGQNRLNEIVSGERVADNREALRQALRREQITLMSVKEKGREIGIPKLAGRKKVKSRDLAIFTRQFSVMIDAGLPLVQCLDILSQQQQNKYFQQVLAQVRQDVEEGSTLAAAMTRHPKVFDQLYANMVEAGETGGILDLILQRLSTFIEKIVKLKRDVVSALIYPVAVILLAIVAIAVIMVVVIPQFQNIFLGLLGPGEPLPLPT